MIFTPSDTDILELLPGHDCGMCGSPTCATFARRLGAGMERVERCKPLKDPTPIINIIKRGVVMGVCGEAVARGTVEMNPCADGDKVTLETQMKCAVKERGCSRFDLLDLQYAANYLEHIAPPGTLSVSPVMGYARWEDGGQRIHLFKRGKLIIRRADSRDTAMAMFERISRVVWPAVICPDTGFTLSNSALTDSCPFTWRPRGLSLEPRGDALPAMSGFWEYVDRFPGATEEHRRAASADVVNVLSVSDSPDAIKVALSAAGALEAMHRLNDSDPGEFRRWREEHFPSGVMPPHPSSDDWKRFKAESNLRAAAACILSIRALRT